MLRELYGHPYEFRSGGLGRLERHLEDGKVSAKKDIFRIADT